MHMLSNAPTRKTAKPWENHRVQACARVLLAVCVLTAASRLRLPFAQTPVPFTLQPQAVIALAAMLGSAEAVAAVSAWLCVGAMGAPVFASALSGTWALGGPTGGYLLSYLPVAWAVGRFGRGYTLRAAAVWLMGAALTLALGAGWLSQYVGANAAWRLGVLPFAATDVYKLGAVFVARLLAKSARRSAT